MPLPIAAIFLTLVTAPPASGGPADCTRFLIGSWAGKGVVTGFGRPITVDNAYTYNRDGSFATINRYLGTDNRWTEQKLAGTWTATPTRARGECLLVLKSTGPMATASSTSEIRMIDKDTFRSLGFDMKRVPSAPVVKTVGSRDIPATFAQLGLAEGMSYTAARAKLASGGFRPTGVQYRDCASIGQAKCVAYPEIEGCSGTGAGFCSAQYKGHDGITYNVITQGPGGPLFRVLTASVE